MIRTIFKYGVQAVDGEQYVDLPVDAEIVHVGKDGPSRVLFWAVIDEQADYESRTFVVVGTGHEWPENCVYRGTARDDAFLVWHLLEKVAV